MIATHYASGPKHEQVGGARRKTSQTERRPLGKLHGDPFSVSGAPHDNLFFYLLLKKIACYSISPFLPALPLLSVVSCCCLWWLSIPLLHILVALKLQ